MGRPAASKTIGPRAGDKASLTVRPARPYLCLWAGNYPGWVRYKTQVNSRAAESGPGDGLVKAGGIVFIVGAVATLVTVAPLFLHTATFPPVAYAVCMLMGVGFLLAAAGVVRGITAQRRQAARST